MVAVGLVAASVSVALVVFLNGLVVVEFVVVDGAVVAVVLMVVIEDAVVVVVELVIVDFLATVLLVVVD